MQDESSIYIFLLALLLLYTNYYRWFRHQKAQVVFLQETYWSRDIENIVRSEWRGPCFFFSHGSNHACGVAILFQQNLAIEQVKVKHGKEGRLLIMHVKIHDISMVLVNVYAPTQKKFLQQTKIFTKSNKEV